jgi:hypothetical protein
MCEVVPPVPLYFFVASWLGTFTYWIDGRMVPRAVLDLLAMASPAGSSQFSKRAIRKFAYKLTFKPFKAIFPDCPIVFRTEE